MFMQAEMAKYSLYAFGFVYNFLFILAQGKTDPFNMTKHTHTFTFTDFLSSSIS